MQELPKALKPKHRYLTLVLLAALSVIYWYKLLIFHNTIFFDLTTRYFLPISSLLAEAVKSFVLPFWNPYIYCGMPFLSNPQNAVFYPLSYIFAFLSFPVALNLYILIHTILAGCFMYFLALEYGMNRYGATAAAIIFMFNGFFSLHTEFLSTIATYAWIPAILLYFQRFLAGRTLKNAIYVSFFIAIQLFAGYPGYSYYTILFLIAYYFWHEFDFKHIAISSKAGLTLLIAVALPSLLITSIQLIPTIEHINNSVRNSGVDYISSVTYSIYPLDFLKFCFMPLWDWFRPFYSGDIHIVGFYMGITALAAVIITIPKLITRQRLFLAVIFVLSALLALGKYFPLYSLFYNFVPGWKYFRFPAQTMLIAVLCFSLLAGFAVSTINSKYFRVILIALIFIELFFFNIKANRFIDLSYYSVNTKSIDFLRHDKSLFRIMLTPKTQSEPPEDNADYFKRWSNFKDMLYPNTGSAYGLSYIDGHETIKQRPVNELLDNIDGPSSPILDIMNMKYMLSRWDIKDSKYKMVKDGYVKIFQNTTCLPRFYFVKQAVFRDKKDIINSMLDRGLNPHETVIIESNINDAIENIKPAEGELLSGITVDQYGLNKANITTISYTGSWLVFSQSYYPGWRAKIDGNLAEIRKANYNFMAVFVQQGRHKIEFSYYPRFFNTGALISIMSLLACFIYLFFGKEILLFEIYQNKTKPQMNTDEH